MLWHGCIDFIKIVSSKPFEQLHRNRKLIANTQGYHMKLFRQQKIKFGLSQPINVGLYKDSISP